jgi:hypothetical protein
MAARQEQKNACDSICCNNESDSIEMDESDLQSEKHEEPRISTVRAMTMDVRKESENASDSILWTKHSALIRTINRRRRTGPANDNFAATAAPSSSTNVTLSIVTTG